MRTLKLIGINLISIVLVLSIAGCNDDNSSTPSGQDHRIKNILYDSGVTAKFYYDGMEQLNEVKFDQSSYFYSWNSNNTIDIEKIDETSGQKNEYGVFTLENGRIVSFKGNKGHKTVLTYNDEGQLVKASTTPENSGKNSSIEFNYSWENGNVMSKKVEGERKAGEKFKYVYNYTYDTSMRVTNLCYFFNGFILNDLFPDLGELFLIVSRPNLIGKEIANAVKHISSSENELNYDIYKTFEYNKKEYPTRVTGKVKQPDNSEKLFVYEITWE